MESQENKGLNLNSITPQTQPSDEYPNRSGRVMGGVVIVAIGLIFLAKQTDAFFLPHWLFSWPMFLIGLGIFIGARHSFRDLGWLIPIVIGLVFLADDYWYDLSLKRFIWPVLIIIAGLAMIFRPKRRKRMEQYWQRWDNKYTSQTDQSAEDFIDCVTIFGGVKKNIISKNFRGGEAVTFFGGTELNLTQADVTDRIELELVQVFGGTKLIVPPHWKIHSEELVSIFGGLNDKRPPAAPSDLGSNKILILKGTCIFGGIDIKSF
jgi:hypothetical protein